MPDSTNMKELTADEVRSKVSGHYASAVKSATQGGVASCCNPADVDLTQMGSEERLALLEQAAATGNFAKNVGYTDEEIASLPEDAVKAAFGCGNPVNLAGIKSGDTVVDLGSGAGIDVILAARNAGPNGHVIGLDMTDDMIEKARANIAEAGITTAEIRKGIIEDMPVDTGTVDWIVSNCVINLSPEKPKVFAEAYRILKPGGQFLVSDIVVGDIPETVRENVLGYVSCVGGAVAEEEYLRIIRDAGFQDVEVVLRHDYTAQEMLAFAGFDQLPDCDMGRAARDMLAQLEGKIASIKIRGRKVSARGPGSGGCC